ncbi:hypothetical protein P9112_012211 [Eukaryota sp. TZLM1-RC]
MLHWLLYVLVSVVVVTSVDPLHTYSLFPVIHKIEGPRPTSGNSRIFIQVSNVPSTSSISVLISQRPCPSVRQHNSTWISCILPSGVGTGHAVHVTADGVMNDQLFTIDYDRPVISSLSTDVIDMTSSFAINGRNFYTESKFIQVSIGQFKCSKITILTDHRSIKCDSFEITNTAILHGIPSPPSLSISVATQRQEGSLHVDVLPSLFDVRDVDGEGFPTSGGVRIGIIGFGFETSFDDVMVSLVTFELDNLGSTLDVEGVIESDSLITAHLPSGFGQFKVGLKVGNFTFSNTISHHFNSPVLEEVISSEFPTAGGVRIQIEGSEFYGNQAEADVYICGHYCPSTVESSHLITTELPPGEGSCELLVVIGGLSSNNFLYFDYDKPKLVIDEPLKYSSEIILTGENFGTNSSLISIFFGSNRCQSVSINTNHYSITCHNLPYLDLTSRAYVAVFVSGVRSENYLVSFAPSIYKIEGNFSTVGGSVVSIRGIALSSLQSLSPTIHFSHRSLPLSPSSFSSSALTVELPPGVGEQEVWIEWSGGRSDSVKFLYDSPEILNVSTPKGMYLRGGDLVVMKGRNFGTELSLVKVLLDQQVIDCDYVDDDELRCLTPELSSFRDVNLSVVVDGQESNIWQLTPSEPKIEKLVSTSGKFSTSGGVEVLIVSTGFGPLNQSISLSVNDSIVNSFQLNVSTVSFNLPAGTGYCTVELFTEFFNYTMMLSYDPPVIIHPEMDVAVTNELVIQGANFGIDPSLISVRLGPFDCPMVEVLKNHNTIQCVGLLQSIKNDSIRFLDTSELVVTVDDLTSTKSVKISPFIIDLECNTRTKKPSTRTSSLCFLEVFQIDLSNSFTLTINSIPVRASPTQNSKISFESTPGCGSFKISLFYENENFYFYSNYQEANISRIHSQDGFPLNGGVSVVVFGRDLGKELGCNVSFQIDTFFSKDRSNQIDSIIVESTGNHEFILPVGFGFGNILPIVDGVIGLPFSFDYDIPLIKAIVSTEGFPTIGGVSVELNAKNLPNCEAFNCSKIPDPLILIDDHVIEVDYWEEDHALFTLKEGIGQVFIQIFFGDVFSNNFLLRYDPFELDSIPELLFFNNLVILRGNNLGNRESEIELTINDYAPEAFTVFNFSVITAQFASDVFFTGSSELSIKIANQSEFITIESVKNVDSRFLLTLPETISINGGSKGSISARIDIFSLGHVEVVVGQDTVDIDYDLSTNDNVVFEIPERQYSTKLPVVLLLNELPIFESEFLYTAPFIESLSERIFIGEPFTIRGVNLLSNDWYILVNSRSVGRWDCELLSDTRIECNLSDDIIDCESAQNDHVLQFFGDGVASDLIPFTLSPLFISSLAPSPSFSKETIVSVTGMFGSSKWTGQISAKIGKKSVEILESSSRTLKLVVPPFEGDSGLVLSYCGIDADPYNVNYDGPFIKSVESPSTRGGEIAVEGGNFDKSSILQISFGNQFFSAPDFAFVSNTLFTLKVDEGSGKGIGVQVLVNSFSSELFTFNYKPPKVAKLDVFVDEDSDLTKFLIKGDDFGPDISHVDLVRINDRECRNVKMPSPHAEISCEVSSAFESGELTLIIGGQETFFVFSPSRIGFWFWVIIVVVSLSVVIGLVKYVRSRSAKPREVVES